MRKNYLLPVLFIAVLLLLTYAPVPISDIEAGSIIPVENSTYNYTDYDLTEAPSGFNIVYYDGITSRGFSWQTNTSATETQLYITEGTNFEEAVFNENYLITGTHIDNNEVRFHHVFVDELIRGESYVYKAGGNGNFVYGAFTVDGDSDDEITIINLNDAQTKKVDELNVWENTVKTALSVTGETDFIAFGGDQFDHNQEAVTSMNNRMRRWAIARDTITNLIGSIPYVATSGNHDALTQNAFVYNNYVNFDNRSTTGGYYSFDYDYLHFIVLNSNDLSNNQTTWLETDLASTYDNPSVLWRIVIMHNGPYATGDHSDNAETRTIIDNYTKLFSTYHVDMVLQAHDHIYSKTLPYLWDKEGKSLTYGNADVVNFDVNQVTENGIKYDMNPNGTYYVSCGAAGHRVGETDGVHAEVSQLTVDLHPQAVNSSKTYTDNKYKIEVGKISCDSSVLAQSKSGDWATSNPNCQMFGKLVLTKERLSYEFYLVNTDGNYELYDTLNIIKDEDLSNLSDRINTLPTANEITETNASEILSIIDELNRESNSAFIGEEERNKLIELYGTLAVTEKKEENIVDVLRSGTQEDVGLKSVQSSAEKNGCIDIRFISGILKLSNTFEGCGFKISAKYGDGVTKTFDADCEHIYSDELIPSADNGLIIGYTADNFSSEYLMAMTITNVPSALGKITFTVQPYLILSNGLKSYGATVTVVFIDGFFASVSY